MFLPTPQKVHKLWSLAVIQTNYRVKENPGGSINKYKKKQDFDFNETFHQW